MESNFLENKIIYIFHSVYGIEELWFYTSTHQLSWQQGWAAQEQKLIHKQILCYSWPRCALLPTGLARVLPIQALVQPRKTVLNGPWLLLVAGRGGGGGVHRFPREPLQLGF